MSAVTATSTTQLIPGAVDPRSPSRTTYMGLTNAELESDPDDEAAGLGGLCKKPLCICLGACCCCGLVTSIVGIIMLNIFVAHGISAYGTQAMGGDVKVSTARINPLTGRADLDGLTFDNPTGMGGRFADLKHADFDVDLWSIGTHLASNDPIHLQHLAIEDVFVRLCKPVGSKKSNIEIIVKNLRKYIGRRHLFRLDFSSGQALNRSWNNALGRAKLIDHVLDKKVIVHEIALRNIHASIHFPIISENEPTTHLNIEEILIKDVGVKTNGVCLYELITVILQRVLSGIFSNLPKQLALQAFTNPVASFLKLIDKEEWFDSASEDMGEGLENMGAFVDDTTDDMSDGVQQFGHDTALRLRNAAEAMGANQKGAEGFAMGFEHAAEKFGKAIEKIGDNFHKGSHDFAGNTKDFLDNTKHGLHKAAGDWRHKGEVHKSD